MMIAHALRERVIAPSREAALRSAIELAERGWLADDLIRSGIRSFVRERLGRREYGACPPPSSPRGFVRCRLRSRPTWRTSSTTKFRRSSSAACSARASSTAAAGGRRA